MTVSVTRLARASIGLVLLLVLLAAPPVLLWTFRSAWLPDHMPSWAEMGEWISGPDTGGVLLGLIVVVGLVAWLQLLIAVAIELAAVVRRQKVPRIRGFGWAQAVAGLMLGLVVTSGTAGAATAATPTSLDQVMPQATISQPATFPTASSSAAEPEDAKSDQSAQERASGPRHEVKPNDSLMGIAKDRLGDENRYAEIFKRNEGKRQPDGDALTDVALIKPGWILELPADATPDTTPAGSARSAGTHEVATGETLSGIADEELGDATRYTEIFELNEGDRQANDSTLTDPDLIHPGTVLKLPTHGNSTSGSNRTPEQPQPRAGSEQPPDPGGRSHAPATGAGRVEPPRQEPKPAEDTSGSATAPREERTPAPENAPVASPPETPAAVPSATATSHDSTTAAGDETPLPLIIGSVGGLLAAGVLAALGARRMIAQRRRRPGHRINNHPNQLGDLETALRMSEEPATAETLDRALRSLASNVRDNGKAFPPIRCAVVGRKGIVLHPATDAEPVAPFTTGKDPATWALDKQAKLLEPTEARDHPAPFPALVTLGHNQARDLVLINLEQVGAVVLNGSPDDVESALLAMAWDLAASAWADHLVVTLVGVGRTTAAHNPDRLRFAETVDDVLDGFERRAHEVAERLAAAGAESIDAARGHDIAEDTWTPEIILSAEAFTGAQQDRLQQLVATEGVSTSLAAVITGPAEEHAALPGAWEIDVSTPSPVVDGLGTIELQRLTAENVRELVAAFAAAENTTQVPAEDFHNVPPEAEGIPEQMPVADHVDHDAPISVEDLDELLETARQAPPADDTTDPDTTTGVGDVVDGAWQVDHADEGGVEVVELHANAPEVCVLGQVGLRGPDPAAVEAKKIRRLTELAAFLALRPGIAADELSRQMGEDTRPWSASTRQGYMSRLRGWFGRDHNGELYVPNVDSGTYRLSDAVRVDWHRFQQLVKRGLNNGDEGLPHLEQALALVTGQPFSGVPNGRYAWADWIRQEMIDAIVDVAHTAAHLHQQAGNVRAARIAILRGLAAEPVSELLYRDLMRLEYSVRNLPGVKAAADKLAEGARELEIDLEPETSELMRELLDPRYRLSMQTQRAAQ